MLKAIEQARKSEGKSASFKGKGNKQSHDKDKRIKELEEQLRKRQQEEAESSEDVSSDDVVLQKKHVKSHV